MALVNVLVVFYSRYGATEKLALAAALGALEAESNIRLRRLPEQADPAIIAADPAWQEAVRRMDRDYVAPRPADATWADVIVLATRPGSCSALETYLDSLPEAGGIEGKLALVEEPADEDVRKRLCGAAGSAGLVVVAAALERRGKPSDARNDGRCVALMARALKTAHLP